MRNKKGWTRRAKELVFIAPNTSENTSKTSWRLARSNTSFGAPCKPSKTNRNFSLVSEKMYEYADGGAVYIGYFAELRIVF